MTDPIRAFWDHFAATIWGRTPAVLRPPFDAALATGDDVFAAALESARRYANPNLPPRVRAYLGAQEQRDATPLLADAADASLDGYLRRLRKMPSNDGFGVMMMQFQSTHDAIWNRVTRLYAGLTRAVGVPIGGSHLDCFVMNQRRGFIGVHKDSQDVFTTVVTGKKRMLLWPFERLRAAAGQGDQLRYRGWRLRDIDESSLRDEAIVLDAERGDIMYWPADYWHNSEGDGEPVVTVGLGVVRSGDPVRFVQRATSTLTQSQTMPTAQLDGAIEWLDGVVAAAFADARYRERVEHEFLRWLTGCGFDEVPSLAPPSELDEAAWIGGTSTPTFAHRRRGGTLTIWSHGNSIDLPAHPALLRLCEAIARGVPFRLGAFLDEAVAAKTAERRDSMRGKLAVILKHMFRARALALIPVEHAPVHGTFDDRYGVRTNEPPPSP